MATGSTDMSQTVGGRVDSSPHGEIPAESRPARRHRRWARVKLGSPKSTATPSRGHRLKSFALGVVALVIVAVVVTSLITVPYEAITPGSTVSVAGLIKVPKNHRHSIRGSVSLVDVNIVSLRAISYLFYRMDSSVQIIPTGEILGTETQSAYNEQGVLDMLTAQQAATYVAFRQLGYSVRSVPNGVAVYATIPRSPAATSSSGALGVGDVIDAIDGRKVTDETDLHDALARVHPGDRVELRVHRLGSARSRTVRLGLGALVAAKGGVYSCEVVTSAHRALQLRSRPPCIGIELTQLYSVKNEPFSVDLNAEGIIGPSAGLAFTLGLMELLDPESLTSGLRIAATGTIALDGTIGDVGGVAQKTIAVRDSGASVFFVPKVEYSTAKANAGNRLRIYPVTSIAQVIRDLESLGGRIVKARTP